MNIAQKRILRTLAISLAFAIMSLSVGCATSPPAHPEARAVDLHLDPACGLAQGPGLGWLIDAKPRAIAEVSDLIPAINLLMPEERLSAFAQQHGGVDLRRVQDLCVARYAGSTLFVVRTLFDPAAIVAAFEQSSTRSVTKTVLAARPVVVRLESTRGDLPHKAIVFGNDTVALEEGLHGPLRAAEGFAFGKLKRTTPALESTALAQAAKVLGTEAPIRAFVPGPFQGELARGARGLLRVATAFGISARWAGTKHHIAIRVVLTGAWDHDLAGAADTLAATAHVLSESPTGHLFGLDAPIHSPTVHVEGGALVLDAVVDGMMLAQGLHRALDASLEEIMR